MKIKFVGEIKKQCWFRNPQATWPVCCGEWEGTLPGECATHPSWAERAGQAGDGAQGYWPAVTMGHTTEA